MLYVYVRHILYISPLTQWPKSLEHLRYHTGHHSIPCPAQQQHIRRRLKNVRKFFTEMLVLYTFFRLPV